MCEQPKSLIRFCFIIRRNGCGTCSLRRTCRNTICRGVKESSLMHKAPMRAHGNPFNAALSLLPLHYLTVFGRPFAINRTYGRVVVNASANVSYPHVFAADGEI